MLNHTALHPTKQHLLDIGKEMIAKHGARHISIRQLTEEANVNLGSFVYHFKTKEAFITQVVETWYIPLLDTLILESSLEENALTRLKSMVSCLIEFIFTHSRVLSQLSLDLLMGEKSVQRFFSSLFIHHPHLLCMTIEQAQRDKLIIPADPKSILLFIMAPIGLPTILMLGYKENLAEQHEFINQLEQFVLDKQRAYDALNWAIRGVSYSTQ